MNLLRADIEITDFFDEEEILEAFSDEELQEELTRRKVLQKGENKTIDNDSIVKDVLDIFDSSKDNARIFMCDLLGLSHYETTQEILDELSTRI
ncbi:MAG: hypothetical protein NC229_08935 [Bacteroides sp.]|nr:hypothetical protein [Bacteroidales bacterium]MCM1068700.1 hypothetical protein [Prevotella sp.]MCM1354768.1 hypothetical protein [Bacteroides sp.]MCM1443683.1 hypothetical protein [Muribaculum sp.]MCM1403882.1 hypothetical protein [Bacteroides sp.]